MLEHWPLPILLALAGIACLVASIVFVASRPKIERERREAAALDATVHPIRANRPGHHSHHGGTK